jgi:hypothetical protein
MLLIALHRMLRGSAAADRRLGISDSVVEPKGFPIPNQLRSLNDALGSQKVEASYFVVIAEHASGDGADHEFSSRCPALRCERLGQNHFQ